MKAIKHSIQRIFNFFGFDIKRRAPSPASSRRSNNKFDLSQGNFKVTSFGWAKANQLLDFNRRQVYNFHHLDAENYGTDAELVERQKWGLKGYGYSTVMELVQKMHLQAGDPLKILDVGGGGSALPRVLSEQFGVEAWLIDDFGIESNEEKTQSWYDPNFRETLPEKNPTVHYVFGRLGGTEKYGLEQGSFDLIYSVSTLEHIPITVMGVVFDHMLELLKPNGAMIHMIDLAPRRFPQWKTFLTDYFKTRGVAPETFEIKNFNELNEVDPVLLEPPEIVALFWGNQTQKYFPCSTLVIEIHGNN
jgi:2-polyprenyl-3-methyl-5-hydroxy-6-metoxy-1,4-benzoquinol methylase